MKTRSIKCRFRASPFLILLVANLLFLCLFVLRHVGMYFMITSGCVSNLYLIKFFHDQFSNNIWNYYLFNQNLKAFRQPILQKSFPNFLKDSSVSGDSFAHFTQVHMVTILTTIFLLYQPSNLTILAFIDRFSSGPAFYFNKDFMKDIVSHSKIPSPPNCCRSVFKRMPAEMIVC